MRAHSECPVVGQACVLYHDLSHHLQEFLADLVLGLLLLLSSNSVTSSQRRGHLVLWMMVMTAILHVSSN
jgi:hypothetical protein